MKATITACDFHPPKDIRIAADVLAFSKKALCADCLTLLDGQTKRRAKRTRTASKPRTKTKATRPMAESTTRLCGLLKRSGPMAPKAIMAKLGIPQSTLQRIKVQLQDTGNLKVVGAGNRRTWIHVEK